MPNVIGASESPFNPRDRPWLVPLAALNHRATTMLVICKACQHKRRWPDGAGPVDPLALLQVRLGGLPALHD